MDALLQADGTTDPSTFTGTTRSEKEGFARERYLTISFIQSTDLQRYGKVSKDLSNHHTLKEDNCPNTLSDAYVLLQNYKVPRKVGRIFANNGVAFVQTSGRSEVDMEKQVTWIQRYGKLYP